MKEETAFRPGQRLGMIFNIGASLVLLGAAGLSLWYILTQETGALLLVFLLPVLLAAVLVPALAYQLYALRNASYVLERDGIRLRWGLRQEDIPMTEVQWVESDARLPFALPRPWLRWPGAVLGLRSLADKNEKHKQVEFMAARGRDLVVIGAERRIYAISPDNPVAFLRAFQRFTEMGSLAPLPSRSVYPTFLFSRVWADPPARGLLLGGIALNLAGVVLTSLGVAARQQVLLGFRPDSSPGDAVPARQLFLLPAVCASFFFVTTVLGFLFFRREDRRPFAYLLWTSGVVTPLLFLIAIILILNSG